ncbi:MAG: hypothetical protein GY774_17895 [Planctomycetes bacterium]|nr:hypothetical protein [Planctomycetota bacterium]
MDSPWILFEAGALVRGLENTIVCPYLVDLQPREVSGPLSQFQSAVANSAETYRLLKRMNDAIGDNRLSEDQLKITFDKFWPDFEQTLATLESDPVDSESPLRADRDVLDEVLEILRAQSDYRTRTGADMREYHVIFQMKFPNAERRVSIAIGPETTVQNVMDALCTDLRGLVPNFSYMEKWMVRGKGGKPRVVIREVQGRIPAQSVFTPGSEWEVIPLNEPYSPRDSLSHRKSLLP